MALLSCATQVSGQNEDKAALWRFVSAVGRRGQ